MRNLIKLLSQMEGKKSEVSIGNIREVIKCLAILLANNEALMSEFMKYVKRNKNRAK